MNKANIEGVKTAYAFFNTPNIASKPITDIPNVTFMSYAKWARLKTQEQREKYLKDVDKKRKETINKVKPFLEELLKQ